MAIIDMVNRKKECCQPKICVWSYMKFTATILSKKISTKKTKKNIFLFSVFIMQTKK